MRGLMCVIGLLFGLAASHVIAQTTTVPVRSGEHADFTRLVIQIPAENSWRVSTTAMQAQLLIEGPPLRFDITQSFARIPRTRLRSLEAAENLLELQLACACEIRAYEDIPQFLVIDILGTPRPESRALPEATRPRPRPPHIDRATAAPVSHRAGILLAQDKRTLPENRSRPVSLTLHGVFGSDRDDRLWTQATDQPVSETPTPATVTAELGQIIARTVAQGVLSPADPQADTVNPSHDLAEQDSAMQQAEITAHLSVPVIAQPPGRTAAAGKADPICQTLEQLAGIDRHSDPALPALPQSVERLYNELDTLDRAAVIDLALDFIALGFGAEAQLVAALLGSDDPLAAPIRAVADIVDHEDAVPAAVAGFGRCGPAGSVWAFLAASAFGDGTGPRFEEVFLGFESLPRPLRLHLGPRLVRKLLDADMIRDANRIQASMDRISGTTRQEIQLAKVALALAQAPPPDEAARLEASLSPEISDGMLLFLLERRDSDAATVDPDLIALAENRLIALRGTTQGERLAELTIRAMGRNGAFHEAFALAGSDVTGLSAQSRDQVLDDLLDMLGEQATDSDFVILVFEQRPWERETLSPARAQQLGTRLSSLGFDAQAALLQQHPGQRAGTEEVVQGRSMAAVSDIEQGADAFSPLPAAGRPDLTALATGAAAEPQVPAGPEVDLAEEVDMAETGRLPAATGNDAPAASPRTEATTAAQADPAEARGDQAALASAPTAPGVLDQSRALLTESSDFRSRLQMLLETPPE